MSIQPAIAHPAYCDARCCRMAGDVNVDHRGTPIEFKPRRDDHLVGIGLARFDSIETTLGYTGEDLIRFELLNLASVNLDGSEIRVGTDLTATEARMIGAALSCMADQLDDLTRRAAA